MDRVGWMYYPVLLVSMHDITRLLLEIPFTREFDASVI